MIKQIIKMREHYSYEIDSDRGLEIDCDSLFKDKNSLTDLMTNIGNTLENNMTEEDTRIPIIDDSYIIEDKVGNGDKNFCKLEIDYSMSFPKFKALTYYFYLGTINNNKGNDKKILVYWIYRFDKDVQDSNRYFTIITKSFFMEEDNYIDLDGPRETCPQQYENGDIIKGKYSVDVPVLFMSDPILRKAFRNFLLVEKHIKRPMSLSVIEKPLDKFLENLNKSQK